MKKIQSISSSGRWLQCTASLQYNNEFKANENTLKGNLIHEVSALRIEQMFLGKNNTEKIEALKNCEYIDDKDPNVKTKWDYDCDKTSDEYINYVVRLYNQYKPYKIMVETRVDLLWYGYKKFGYIDLIMLTENYVIIVDLKSGRTKVQSEDNSQMLMYAIGYIQTYGKKEANKKDYVVSICQPLINNIESFVYSLSEISNFYASKKEKMNEIITDNLVYAPSTVACKYCDYRDKCAERIKKGVI